jgi:hypothetical protein
MAGSHPRPVVWRFLCFCYTPRAALRNSQPKVKYYLCMNPEALAELQNSPSFLSWTPEPKPSEPPKAITLGRGRPFIYQGETYTNLIVDEKHFSPADLAKAWGVSAETVRQIFREEPGVLRLGSGGNRQTRSYVSLRIPQSVAVRVHARLSAIPQSR